jgi:hypothetical protein
MRHEFHPEALLEFEEAVQFYKVRGRALGQRFAKEIRGRARVFPYAVLYSIEDDYILIVAIAHGKRRPGYWRHRLTTP